MNVKSTIISSILLLHCVIGFGQPVCDISFYYFEETINDSELYPTEFIKIDSLQLHKAINQRLNNLYEIGYLSASSIKRFNSENEVEVIFFTHQVFEFVNLSQGNVNEEIMSKVGFDPGNFINRPFSHQKLVGLLNLILDYAENHGYPFASVKLDSISLTNNEIGAWLNYQSGPKIIFDSLIISGYDKIKLTFLMTHLGIYSGEAYEEKLISEIQNRIKLLPFVSLAQLPEIKISNGKCNVLLDLESNKVSSIDGILGVLPNQTNGESLLITGQLTLDLYNLFSSGKRLALEWQGYDANSQLLDVLYDHPNLFRTPINILGNFHLLKQDTTFINRKLLLELSILSKKSNRVGFKTEFISSRLISTEGLADIVELPDNTNYNINYYGVDYQINKFDEINYPTSGWALSINGSVGQKKIIKNPIINEDIYKDIALNSIQIKIEGEVERYWRIYRSILLRTKISGGYLDGDHLFQSDMFRIGGLNSLRGFAENQIYTSGFGIANFEFRALVSKKTYFMIFFDQAVMSNNFETNNATQFPFGTGAGFSFSTIAGIFNFVFAMGKSENQPFGIEYSKIHFGYISRF